MEPQGSARGKAGGSIRRSPWGEPALRGQHEIRSRVSWELPPRPLPRSNEAKPMAQVAEDRNGFKSDSIQAALLEAVEFDRGEAKVLLSSSR